MKHSAMQRFIQRLTQAGFLVAALSLLAACGGGGGGDGGAPPPPPPPAALTYSVELTGLVLEDSRSGADVVATGLPLQGAEARRNP